MAIAPTLLSRVLGSSADAVGDDLRHYTEYRLGNAGRIIERAAAKSRSLDNGNSVNLRVAHVLIADGSYSDDPLVADYLGGLLAASRTPEGRDDRAVAWSKLISSLSSLQIRAHYLLYREWAARLRVIGVYELGVDAVRSQAAMEISADEFTKILAGDSEVDENDALSHAIGGLVRVRLLADNFFYNGELVNVAPSITGIELYGWAQGLPGLSPRSFASKAQPFDLADAIPRLGSVTFPKLPEHADISVPAGGRQRQVQVQRQARGAKVRRRSDA